MRAVQTALASAMFFCFFCLLLVASTSVQSERIIPREYACSQPPTEIIEPLILNPLPHTHLSLAELPMSFDWRNIEGTVYVTRIGNQEQPKMCGSCWAFATTSSMADRMKIMTGAQNPDIVPSVQVLLDCGELHGTGSCNGGSSQAAFKFITEFGITDETCSPYLAVDQVLWAEVPCQYTMCRTCDRFGTCYNVNATTQYYIAEHGRIEAGNITQMMAEIYARGPIVCAMYAHSDDFENYKGGIINETTVYPYTTHDVSIVGWGTSESGVEYWIVRNSFGTNWGVNGWFLIERGTNCLLIESSCGWGVPQVESEELRIEYPYGRNALLRNIKFKNSFPVV